MLDVVKSVEKAGGRSIEVHDAPRRAGDPPALVAGADKVRSELGWQPQHNDLDEIVASALAWEQHLQLRNDAA